MKRTPPPVVYVNGRYKETLPTLGFGQLVALAFGRDDGRPCTITWHVEGTNQGGELGRGDSINVVEGLRIDVAYTGEA